MEKICAKQPPAERVAFRKAFEAPWRNAPGNDWISKAFSDPEDQLGSNLSEAAAFKVPAAQRTHAPRILVLYGAAAQGV